MRGYLPPGTWFDSKEYEVFVGGCGIASAKTLPQAKKLLVEGAKRHLQRNINKHLDMADKYKAMMAEFENRLAATGLGKTQKS